MLACGANRLGFGPQAFAWNKVESQRNLAGCSSHHWLWRSFMMEGQTLLRLDFAEVTAVRFGIGAVLASFVLSYRGITQQHLIRPAYE